MKFSKILFVFALALFVLVGCEKTEQQQAIEETVQTNQGKAELQETPEGEPIDITRALEKEPGEAETRGPKVLLFTDTVGIGHKGWKLYRFSRLGLLPGYKYVAVVTPLVGDPDLYIYGYDQHKTNPWRKIRQSNTVFVDQAPLWRNDLKVSEEFGYIAIYGYSATRFKVEIYRENVCGTEDCLVKNPNRVRYVREGSRYLITDGISRMLIAPNLAEARQIVRIFRHYQINRTCFVGRPGASFTYYTRNGLSPVGAIAGEDCLSFNINNIEVKEINGRWKIVDGNHWMFDFNKNKEEAYQTLCLIKKYGFTKSCYVGRPNPSMQYMRK